MSKQAKSVLESYPTFSEIFNDVHEKCKPNPQLYTMMGAYKNSLQWEGLTWPVDMLCNMMTESPFQGGYAVQNSKKNEGVDAKGSNSV